MKKSVWSVVLASAMVLAAWAAGAVPTADDPAAWKDLTPDQIARVKAGEVVLIDQDTSEGEDQKRFIQAAMIVDRPIEEVWTLLKKTELQDRYLPDLAKCDLVKRDKAGDLVDFHVKILVVSIDYRVHHRYDEEHYKLWWTLDPTYDNDMNQVDGFWQLYKLDEKRTLLRYGTKVEVASFIPDMVMERLTKSNLPANMDACYKYIESGGTYTKPEFEDKK